MCDLSPVTLLADELEALRLCDAECLTQEQAGVAMGVSRGTIQRLVVSGRQKVVTAIAAGNALVVEALDTPPAHEETP